MDRMWWDATRPTGILSAPCRKLGQAVEKAGPWKPWKTTNRFPTAPTVPWESRKTGGLPTNGMVRRSPSSKPTDYFLIWEVIVKIHAIGIDLSKTTFHVVGLDEKGAVVLRRKQSRKQLLIYTANLPSALIGMEACGGAHYLGRALEAQGHQVRLMPAQWPPGFEPGSCHTARCRPMLTG